MNVPNKKKIKLLTNTLNSERYIRFNHKRFINRSDLKKLVTQWPKNPIIYLNFSLPSLFLSNLMIIYSKLFIFLKERM